MSNDTLQSICETCKNSSKCPVPDWGIYEERRDWLEPIPEVAEFFGEEDLPTQTAVITNCPKYKEDKCKK